MPVEALSSVPEILHGDCRGRVCDLTALESQVKLDFQCCSFLSNSWVAVQQHLSKSMSGESNGVVHLSIDTDPIIVELCSCKLAMLQKRSHRVWE